MAIAVSGIRSLIAVQNSPLASTALLLGLALSGAITYAAAVISLWWLTGTRPGAEQRVLQLITRLKPRGRLVRASL
jgi:hypothetical protein